MSGMGRSLPITVYPGNDRYQYKNDEPRPVRYVRIGPETAVHWLLIF
jgi:hypothetical protein